MAIKRKFIIHDGLDLNSGSLVNIAEPITGTDVITKQYADTKASLSIINNFADLPLVQNSQESFVFCKDISAFCIKGSTKWSIIDAIGSAYKGVSDVEYNRWLVLLVKARQLDNTTHVDFSKYEKALTCNNVLDTNEMYVNGKNTTSLKFASSSYIGFNIPDYASEHGAFQTDNLFTIEFYVAPMATSGGAGNCIFTKGNSASAYDLKIYRNSGGYIEVKMPSGAILTSTHSVPTTVFTHVALTSAWVNSGSPSTTLKLYINGTLSASMSLPNETYGFDESLPNLYTQCKIGYAGSDPSLIGYIDNFKMYQFYDKYTSNFTPVY